MILPARRATIDDLYLVEGKAELIGGRIVRSMASGYAPAKVAFRIAMHLEQYTAARGEGHSFPDGIGYAVRPPLSSGRESFSPDASYYRGPLPANPMRFIEGAPDFAVEVRSAEDYGRSREAELAAKRDDYFEAGTSVVWDVDPVSQSVASYSADRRQDPLMFVAGDLAHAEPALPGWRLNVADLFAGLSEAS